MDKGKLIGGALLAYFLFRGTSKKNTDNSPLPELPRVTVDPNTLKGLSWSKVFDPLLASAILEASNRLGFDPNCVMSIVALERGITGGKLGDGVYHSYKREGKTYTGDFSHGLIGLLAGTAFWLGTTPEALYKMSDLEQVKYLELYFTKHGWNKGGKKDVTGPPSLDLDPTGSLTPCDQIYMGVFYGDTGIATPLYGTILSKEKDGDLYDVHKKMGLDPNDDGKVTKKEILSVYRNFLREGAKQAL